jgi:hypothetical protein
VGSDLRGDIKGGNGVEMIREDQKTEEFLAGMERLSENGRNYISNLTRSLFRMGNPALVQDPWKFPLEIPLVDLSPEIPKAVKPGDYGTLRRNVKKSC